MEASVSRGDVHDGNEMRLSGCDQRLLYGGEVSLRKFFMPTAVAKA